MKNIFSLLYRRGYLPVAFEPEITTTPQGEGVTYMVADWKHIGD